MFAGLAARSKFGVPIGELSDFGASARSCEGAIVELQAHVGSGLFDVDSWRHTARLLAQAATEFPRGHGR